MKKEKNASAIVEASKSKSIITIKKKFESEEFFDFYVTVTKLLLFFV